MVHISVIIFFFITNSAVCENSMYTVSTRLMHQVDFKKIITRQIRARFIGKFLLLKKKYHFFLFFLNVYESNADITASSLKCRFDSEYY